MPGFDAVLIYDGECPYCSIAARALKQVNDIGALSWYTDTAQSFLRAQFGDTPFAMVLVDESEGLVYGGRAAAEELAERAGTPEIVGSLLRDNYETIARVVGLASGRRQPPDDVHERYPLTDAGAGLFDSLAADAVNRDIRATT